MTGFRERAAPGRVGRRRRALIALSLCLLAASAVEADDAQKSRAAYERGARAIRQGDAAEAANQLARAAALEPADAEIQALYGQALLASGQPGPALEALERAIELAPDTEGLSYYAGLASYRLGDWQRAIRYLEQAASEQPESGVTALYLGIALSEAGRTDDARASLSRAASVDPTVRGQCAYRIALIELEAHRLDEAAAQFQIVVEALPGSSLARSAQAYLDQLEGGLRSWNVYAQIGGGYDTNVSLGPDELVGLGIESGLGEAAVGGDIVLYETDRFAVRAGQQAYLRFHGSSPANQFDQIVSSTWATGVYDISNRLSAQLGYTFQYIWADYSDFRSTHVVEPSLRLNAQGRFPTTFFYRMEARDYRFDLPASLQALDRDGFVHRLGLEQYWITPDWTGYGSGYVKLGLQLRRESTDGSEYDASSIQPVATVGISLPRDLYLTVDASYEWRDFDSASIVDPSGKARFDWITQVGAALRVPVYGNLYGDVRYRFTNRSSNVAFYRYDRHFTDFVLTYLY